MVPAVEAQAVACPYCLHEFAIVADSLTRGLLSVVPLGEGVDGLDVVAVHNLGFLLCPSCDEWLLSTPPDYEWSLN